MKTIPSFFKLNSQQLSLVMLGLVAAGSIGVAGVNFLSLKEAQDDPVFHSNSWHNTTLVTKAGLEKVLAVLNPKTGAGSSPSACTNNVRANGSDLLILPHKRGQWCNLPEPNLQPNGPDASPSPLVRGWGEWEFRPTYSPGSEEFCDARPLSGNVHHLRRDDVPDYVSSWKSLLPPSLP
jgi:hypothetical protein